MISGLENKIVVSGVEHPTGSAGATTGAPLNGNAVRAPSIDQIVADAIAAGRALPLARGGRDAGDAERHRSTRCTPSRTADRTRATTPSSIPRAVFERLFTGRRSPADDAGGGAGRQARAGSKERARRHSAGRREPCSSGSASADRQRVEAAPRGDPRHRSGASTRCRPTDTQPPACSSRDGPDGGPGHAERSAAGGEHRDGRAHDARARVREDARALVHVLAARRARLLPAPRVGHERRLSRHHLPRRRRGSIEPAARRHGRPLRHALPERVLDEAQGHAARRSNLLDATLVYVTSDTAWGKTHTKTEWPVLFAGKAGGRLRGDEHHNFPGDNLSKALLTVAQIMGSTVTEHRSRRGQGHLGARRHPGLNMTPIVRHAQGSPRFLPRASPLPRPASAAPANLPVPPQGFDARSNNIPHGQVEVSVMYPTRNNGMQSRDGLQAAGYSTGQRYPVLICITESAVTSVPGSTGSTAEATKAMRITSWIICTRDSWRRP